MQIHLNCKSSTGLEVTIVSSFFRKLSSTLNKEKKHCNSENIEDFRKVQRQVYCKIVKDSFQFKEMGNKILHPAFQRVETYARSYESGKIFRPQEIF